MSELRICPACGHRQHEVADDGTIPTWIVNWSGDEVGIGTGQSTLSSEKHKRLLELRAKHPERQSMQWMEPSERRISNRESCFIHYKDALDEYGWIKNALIERGDWEAQKDRLTLTDGERALWDELFGEHAIWMA